MGTRAAAVGFDWERASDVLGKIEEEVAELREAVEGGGNPARVEEEMGDVFENDPFGEALGGAEQPPAEGRSLKRLARRLTPPTVDPELHEM